MEKWIEKQMDLERRVSKIMMTILAVTFLFFALIMGYLALTPVIDGVYTLDTLDKVKRFSQKDYMDGVLTYHASLDTMSEAVFTSSRGSSVNIFANGGYMEAPLPSDTEEKAYHVWRLAGDGYTVLYLTEGEFRDTGTVHVESKDRDFNASIIRDFAPNGSNIYVMYDAGSPAPYFSVILFFLLTALVILILNRSGILRKRTLLGRQIAAMGDYDRLTDEINMQAKAPLFDNSACTILRDWALFRANSMQGAIRSTIVRTADITDIVLTKDEDDDSLHDCAFTVNNRNEPITVYVKDSEAEKLKSLSEEILNRKIG